MSTFNNSVIRKFLQDKLSGNHIAGGGCFIFRRVGWVSYPANVLPIYTKFTLPNEEPEVITNLPHGWETSRVDKEIDKSIQIDYESFFGVAEPRFIRGEPFCTQNKEVAFSSSTYRNFNITGLTFEFERVKPITPMEGDLLCIWLSSKTCERNYGDRRNYERPMADAWFIASEQYLRAYTAIMFDMHDALTSVVPKSTPRDQRDLKLKEKLFSGNRLMTNTWLKTKLAYEQNNEVFPREESIKAYWHLRCDNASRYYVDVFAALVLISRYGELPCASNVPNTKDGGFQRVMWNLPTDFVEKLFELSGCKPPEMPVLETASPEKRVSNYPQVSIPEEKITFLPEPKEVMMEWDVYKTSVTVQTHNLCVSNSCVTVKVQTPTKKKTSFEIMMELDWADDSKDYLYELK